MRIYRTLMEKLLTKYQNNKNEFCVHGSEWTDKDDINFYDLLFETGVF